MADKDYKFQVLPSNLLPFGPVGKENLDVIRLEYDFSCYLDTGEDISSIEFPTISVVPPSSSQGQTNWRQDFPPDDSTTVVEGEPNDTYPLLVIEETLVNAATQVNIRVVAGTPGFTYALSFIAVASTSLRRKQIDTLIRIEIPVNAAMVGPGVTDPASVVAPIVVSDTTALPMGFDGLVILQNSSNADGIVITLPPNPVQGQEVEFIDSLGTDAAHPVTFRGDSNVPIDGGGLLAFASSINFDCLRFVWMGANWHMEFLRFGQLA